MWKRDFPFFLFWTALIGFFVIYKHPRIPSFAIFLPLTYFFLFFAFHVHQLFPLFLFIICPPFSSFLIPKFNFREWIGNMIWIKDRIINLSSLCELREQCILYIICAHVCYINVCMYTYKYICIYSSTNIYSMFTMKLSLSYTNKATDNTVSFSNWLRVDEK